MACLPNPVQSTTAHCPQSWGAPTSNQTILRDGLAMSSSAMSKAMTLAQSQHGLLTRRQLVDLGYSRRDGVDLGRTAWLTRPRCEVADVRWLTHPGVRKVRIAGLLVASRPEVIIDLLRVLPQQDATTVASRALQTGMVSLGFLLDKSRALFNYLGGPKLAAVTGVSQLRGCGRSAIYGVFAESFPITRWWS